MRVEVEDGVPGQRDVSPDNVGIKTELEHGAPDFLVHDESVRVVGQRSQQEVEGVA